MAFYARLIKLTSKAHHVLDCAFYAVCLAFRLWAHETACTGVSRLRLD